MQNFLLVGTGSSLNRGCEAIVRGTVEILSKHYSHAQFILSPFLRKMSDALKMETNERIEQRIPRSPYIDRFSMSWWKYRILLRAFPELLVRYKYGVQLEAMKESDCALQIGGDNYSLEYGIPNAFIQLDKALHSTGKPLILWGASVGPFTKNPEVEKMMKEHLARFSLICARESETVSYLSSIGIEKNVRLVADPAFLMQPEKPHLTDELLNFIGERPLGLNLSPLVGRYKTGNQKGQWVKEAAVCIESLIDSDTAPILLVPHAMDELNNDYEFMVEAVKNGPGWSDRLRILPPNLIAPEYKWCISKLRAFIGARTHSTIAALSSCIPTISIGYSMKARGINKDTYGYLDWLISISELTQDALLTKVKELLSSEQSIRSELEKKVPEIKSRALSAGDYLAEFLG